MSTSDARKRDHITRQHRGADGRVVATYSHAQLYQLVRKGAYKARPGAPEKLSVREFDRTVGSLGYLDAPSARAICARLKRGWPEIVELALEEKASTQKLNLPKKRKEAAWLTVRNLVFALKRVALFKQVETMTPHEYDAWLEEMLASRPQPAHVLGAAARFPTSDQIIRIAASLDVEGATSWEKALRQAGLVVMEAAKLSASAKAKGVTLAEAISLYIDATGGEFYPSKREVERVRSELKVSIAKGDRSRNWNSHVAEAKDARLASGLGWPEKKAGWGMNVPLTPLLGDVSTAPEIRTPKGRWQDDEAVIAALALYVAARTANGGTVTQADYRVFSKGRRDLPGAATICARKPWTEWMAIVQKRMLEAKKKAA